jgi:hypothetical protein
MCKNRLFVIAKKLFKKIEARDYILWWCEPTLWCGGSRSRSCFCQIGVGKFLMDRRSVSLFFSKKCLWNKFVLPKKSGRWWCHLTSYVRSLNKAAIRAWLDCRLSYFFNNFFHFYRIFSFLPASPMLSRYRST